MKKAFKELGIKKIGRFFWQVSLLGFFNVLGFPPFRRNFLRIMGSKIGSQSIIHKFRIFNLYRGGFSHLKIGRACFVGDDCLLDLADKITLGDQVTLAERVSVLTHTNVGYEDHPLQKYFPRKQAPVVFEGGCFIGANATILPGVVVGEKAFVAAGSVVVKDVLPETLVAGVPAKPIRKINEKNENK